jgi:hypothetical protein
MDYPEPPKGPDPSGENFTHLTRLFGHLVREGLKDDPNKYVQDLLATPLVKFMSYHRDELETHPQLWQNTTSYVGKQLIKSLQTSLTQDLDNSTETTSTNAVVIPAIRSSAARHAKHGKVKDDDAN